MQRELEDLITKLKTMAIVDNHEDYNYLVSCTDKYDNKGKIFELLRNRNNAPGEMAPLLFTFTSKLGTESDEGLLVRIIDFIRGCRRDSRETSEWMVKILFLILEKVKEKRKDSAIRLRLLECIRIYSQDIGLVNHMIDLMCTKSSSEIIGSILESIPSVSHEFIECAMKQDNPALLKNLSLVLPSLSEKDISLFVNYESFEEFLESEHFFMRNCFLEICANLVEHFKKKGMVEKMNDLIGMVVERLSDTYFLTRYKALQVLECLFQRNSIGVGRRHEIIREIGGRVLDKTVVVRKKAIGICSGLLMSHPFASEKSLEKKNFKPSEDENNSNYPDNKKKEVERRYHEDLNEFHDIMREIQDNVIILLNGETKTEIAECVEFVKLSFYYKIDGSKEAFESLFDLVWTQDQELLVLSFKDLIMQMKMSKISLFGFFKEFIRKEGNHSFERMIRELSTRRYIDKSFVGELYNTFLQGAYLFETSYLLRHIGRPVPVDMFHSLALSITNLLFSIQEEKDLVEMLSVYKNIIQIKIRERVEFDGEIIEMLIKNLVKMTFFEHQVTEITVSVIYSISRFPEKSIIMLLEKLCMMEKSMLKVISAVGYIGLKHMKYLEELERLVKSNRIKVKVDKTVITPEIVERRRSINASRQSISTIIEEERDGNSTILSDPGFSNNISSRIGDKSEEEIIDFFFYIKEKEMLYGKSILSIFKRIVEDGCHSNDEEIQVCSYVSLYRLMCISFEFFTEHYDVFVRSMNHPVSRVRANAVVAMGDFLLNYNTVAEQHTYLLLESLSDADVDVRRNALLVIHNLLMKNILKIKGYGSKLAVLLIDEETEIREMAEHLLVQISKKENMMSVLLYETITAGNDQLSSVIGFFRDLVSEKVKESLFLKALKSKVEPETLRLLHSAFDLDEKMMEVVRLLDGSK
ncbi:chromosome condensation complex Condensin subunit D2 [Encephalitozoon intestinalis ATCC 50506]|uniref:Chromosome condensation complex Condensin subunit D2 n=1 Tax=Encephalitozoon intestinalis (strain ATCC 50506) TaxID=876142 RepID=E0S5Y2_ENCIT|nr:chromosome condensation complex Condensin subunit D2 [Encephalitozoon intestinalis ATCC 50506]ADM11117.1 chromosome condensation complex Condensin subunit D2 [Encephalitozoon intestinalis ATCC 50506]UTX44771.1 chromosome condensation complex condesin [Encephalitozoon intestinalis]